LSRKSKTLLSSDRVHDETLVAVNVLIVSCWPYDRFDVKYF